MQFIMQYSLCALASKTARNSTLLLQLWCYINLIRTHREPDHCVQMLREDSEHSSANFFRSLGLATRVMFVLRVSFSSALLFIYHVTTVH